MEVVVRTTTRGPNFKKTLEVNEEDTLLQLKSKICEVFGVSPNSQRLLCFGKEINDDSKTLEILGVKDEAVIILLRTLSSAPDQQIQWRNPQPGLCYEGTCNNPKCPAYQQGVIINLGHCKSIFQKDKWECRCPACDIIVPIHQVAFFNCKWKFEGYKDHGLKSFEEGITGSSYTLSPSNTCKWSYLEFTTERVNAEQS